MFAARPRRLALAVSACLLVAHAPAPAARAQADGPPPSGYEVVELIPDDKAGITPGHLFSPITSLFRGGPDHWYGRRSVVIETTPPDADLELFYVRRSFQKGYERAVAPAEVVLPSRNSAGKRDVLTIRASLDGYQPKELSLPIRSDEDRVLIELEPLANLLVAVDQRYFVDRLALGLLTQEKPTLRVQQREGGFTVILVGTGNRPEALSSLQGMQNALVKQMRAQQLGEDLMLRIELSDRARELGIELRSREGHDPVRRLHRYSLDFAPPDRGADAVQRTLAALQQVSAAHVRGCRAERFDSLLHERLDPAALARALSPSGSFIDPVLRAALKRLGELSGGSVELGDGSSFRSAVPLELEAALAQAAEVRGYLAMLGALVDELERPASRVETLRGLIAPELPLAEFSALHAAAESAARSCGGA